ncbi:hypothetical protein [Mesorhizobium sp. WSM2239]|uniref:Uncharacterized protein n=2 Tax=unclassified Mesorhizobium TaxID=325217 RepID=A0AAU8DA05_9HYPH
MAAVIAKVADMPASAPNMMLRMRSAFKARSLPDPNGGSGRMFPNMPGYGDDV